MIKRIFAVVLGVLAGGTSVWFVENWLSHVLIERPDSRFPQDPELVGEYIAALPIGALWMVVLAMLIGGFVASLVARGVVNGSTAPGRDAGLVMLLFAVINLIMIPHPTWLTILMPMATIIGSLIAIRIPMGSVAVAE